MNIKYVFICLAISIVFTGCTDNFLSSPGMIKLGAGSGGGSSISSANYNSQDNEHLYAYAMMKFTVEKVEISQNGYDWITILGEPIELDSANWIEFIPEVGTLQKIAISLTESLVVEEGDYYAVRIWFGPNVEAKTYDVEVSSYVPNAERTRTDFNVKLYPLNIYHQDCKYAKDNSIQSVNYMYIDDPIPVRRGRETELLLRIDAKTIANFVVDDVRWPSYRDNNLDRSGVEIIDDVSRSGGWVLGAKYKIY